MITFISIVLLFAWDADGMLISIQVYAALEAFLLAGIAVAYLLYLSALRLQPAEWKKAIMLVAAFLFWAANQVWPDLKQALSLNDVAIALFVLDPQALAPLGQTTKNLSANNDSLPPADHGTGK